MLLRTNISVYFQERATYCIRLNQADYDEMLWQKAKGKNEPPVLIWWWCKSSLEINHWIICLLQLPSHSANKCIRVCFLLTLTTCVMILELILNWSKAWSFTCESRSRVHWGVMKYSIPSTAPGRRVPRINSDTSST